MDHSDYYDEDQEDELESGAFEYVVPLSGDSPSPGVGRSADNDGSMEFHNNEESRNSTNRRISQETDATTPRFHNINRCAMIREDAQVGGGLPSIPFADRSERSLEASQNTGLGDFLANNNNNHSSVGFNLDRDDHDSLPSLPLHAVFAASPTSNAASSYSKKSDHFRRSAQQIGMDGAITKLPLSPGSIAEESSTMHSKTGYPSPKKPRTESHQLMHSSMYSVASHGTSPATERYPSDRMREHDVSSEDEDNIFMPIQIFGFVLPVCISAIIRGWPSLDRISRCVVHILPCFWYCGLASPESYTDRAVLIRLTIICLFMNSVQVLMAMWLAFVLLFLDDEAGALRGFAPHLWNLNGATFSVGILAFILMLTCFCTIRVMREVDLVGAIRYLWVIFWIVPFEIFFNVSLYDTYSVTVVWIRHWWYDEQMSWFRKFYCEGGTYLTKCLVPIGNEFESEEEWCLTKYNATDCEVIRDDAQENMEMAMLTFYTALAGWTSILLVVMLLMVNSLERIITKPIVQKSRETNVPAWLSLPTITNALVGSVFLFSPSSVLSSSSGSESSWIGIVYLVAAGLFLMALLTGWFLSVYTIQNHGDKQTKNVAVILMVIMMAANVVMLGTIFVASILFSANLLVAPIDESQRGEVACTVDRNQTCTQCDALSASDQCPEWSLEEVTTILQAQLKQSATLAAIFILYAVSVLRFGVTLRKHLSLYQIDYV